MNRVSESQALKAFSATLGVAPKNGAGVVDIRPPLGYDEFEEAILSQQPSRKRPFGLIAIIILKIVDALSLAGDVMGLSFSSLPTLFPVGWDSQDLLIIPPNSADLAFIITLTVGLVLLTWQLAIVIGLWFLKRWAWFLIMIQLGLSMAIYLWAYFQGVPLYIYMLFNVIMVFYLNQSEVQHAFGHSRKPQQEIV